MKTAAVRHEGHWLTWRRALTGGVLAFAVLGVVVAGYMTMRALGIGPVGSLVAAGVLDERERIIVADFSSPASDTGLGPVVSEALRIDLAQSPIVTVMQPSAVSAVLVRMRRAQDSKLDLATAREVAIRDGVKAVVAGEIRTIGAGYVLSTRLLSAANGDVLAADRETAADSTQIIAAVDNLSRRLRERIGESLRTIRGDRPLQEVTTGSLHALRKYSQAMQATDYQNDAMKAIALLEEAIELDTGFAMAYRKLGVVLRNRGEERDRSVAMLTKAYELRDRLTDRERYLTIASYHHAATFDREKAIAALQAILDIYPDDYAALNNLGLEHSQNRQPTKAAEMFARAFGVESTFTAFSNLLETEWSLGKFSEAERLHALMVARLPGNQTLARYPLRFAAARGHYARAESLARVFRETYKTDAMALRGGTSELGRLALLQGRLREGERHFREVVAMREARQDRGEALDQLLSIAFLDAWFRHSPVSTRNGIATALARHPLSAMKPLDRPYIWLAGMYAIAGDPAKARTVLQEYEQTLPATIRRDEEADRRWAMGQIALAEGRHRDAIAEFIASDEGECSICSLPPLAHAYDLAGEPDSTIALYERYLSTPYLDRRLSDWIFVGPIHKRLGELYEERGDRARSAEHYSRFIELWKNADPELQPSVAEARRRLALVTGEPRS